MKSKEQKENYRTNKWKKRICITEDSHEFIREVMIKKKYKTMAGTLDFIINEYKNESNNNTPTKRIL